MRTIKYFSCGSQSVLVRWGPSSKPIVVLLEQYVLWVLGLWGGRVSLQLRILRQRNSPFCLILYLSQRRSEGPPPFLTISSSPTLRWSQLMKHQSSQWYSQPSPDYAIRSFRPRSTWGPMKNISPRSSTSKVSLTDYRCCIESLAGIELERCSWLRSKKVLEKIWSFRSCKCKAYTAYFWVKFISLFWICVYLDW